MTAGSPSIQAPGPGRGLLLLPALGLTLLYAPAYAQLFPGLWQTEVHAHAPLVGLIALALLAGSHSRLAALPDAGWSPLALLGLVPGLLLAIIGRAQEFHLLTMASQPLVIGGGIVLLYGRGALRFTWFPLLFLLFMVPMPGVIVESVTGVLKVWISVAVEELLYAAGYPVARSGVILTVGQYQLLVAEACSGLYSIISLTALGALYVHLVQPRAAWHNLVLLLGLVPVALAANLLRVLVLVLVTYHAGDSSARALHDALGVSVFVVALLLIALDRLLAALCRGRGG